MSLWQFEYYKVHKMPHDFLSLCNFVCVSDRAGVELWKVHHRERQLYNGGDYSHKMYFGHFSDIFLYQVKSCLKPFVHDNYLLGP